MDPVHAEFNKYIAVMAGNVRKGHIEPASKAILTFAIKANPVLAQHNMDTALARHKCELDSADKPLDLYSCNEEVDAWVLPDIEVPVITDELYDAMQAMIAAHEAA